MGPALAKDLSSSVDLSDLCEVSWRFGKEGTACDDDKEEKNLEAEGKSPGKGGALRLDTSVFHPIDSEPPSVSGNRHCDRGSGSFDLHGRTGHGKRELDSNEGATRMGVVCPNGDDCV